MRNYLQTLSPREIQSAAFKAKGQELRIATLLSLTVLAAARDLAVDVPDTIQSFAKRMRAPPQNQSIFDIVVFETAAFAHYALMAPYLTDDDESDEPVDEDPYFATLRTGAHISGGIVASHTDFELPDNFFMHRVSSYTLVEVEGENFFNRFQALLASSMEGGTPHAGRSNSLSLDMALTLGLAATVLPFCSTMLPALTAVARNAYDHADELGLLE
jgi:hypothetical protein